MGGKRRLLPLALAFCLLANAATAWDISLVSAEKIRDQGTYPYCGFYAMSSFLELWGKSGTPHKIPALDPSYLAVAYNTEIGNGSGGSHTIDMIYLAQKYGIIPDEAPRVGADSKSPWPLNDWRELHKTLMPLEMAKAILSSEFIHPSVSGQFTGKQYLEKQVGLDFRNLTGFASTYSEECHASTDTSDGPELYRGKDYPTVVKELNIEKEKMGLATELIKEDPSLLYTLLVAHLYQKRPALLSFRTGYLKKGFTHHELVTAADLEEVGKARCGTHIGVAVGHCHKKNTASALCSPFQKQLQETKTSECVVFQNSWGVSSNHKGYACFSPGALNRALSGTVLLRSLY